MKRLLTLLLSLLLICPAALAEEPDYSPALAAKKLAIAAMYDKYNFTPETLGVFTVAAETAGDVACVHFYCEFLPYSRVGQYTALIDGAQVNLTWSYDNADPAPLAVYNADTPFWGPRQIEVYLTVDTGKRHTWLKPYYESWEQDVYLPASTWLDMSLERLPDEQTMRPPQAVFTAAQNAIIDVFRLTDAEFARLNYTSRSTYIDADGKEYYTFTYSELNLCFQVLMDAETNQVIDVTLSSGGNG